MSSVSPGVDLVFVWHHHQPDYRRPADGKALLPWVRLHATKDYLDMALHLERHPGVKATFNFAPSLLDQLEHARTGGADALFELLAKPPAALSAEERAELQARSRMAPRWARERWPQYQQLCEKLRAPAVAGDAELLRLNVFLLLAWLDPLLMDEPVAAAAERAALAGTAGLDEREALLRLHAEILDRVMPAYLALAARGQIELTCSPAYHPILPLLVDVKTARRARPDQPSPTEDFAAPEDAAWHIARGLELAEAAFGARPVGMWPSEGSVSPEAAELLAAAGVRWVATDEMVLWRSLGEGQLSRAKLYQPWVHPTSHGDLALFFRDHELSDRIGFVYSTWGAAEAAADFVQRLRKIGEAHDSSGLAGRPVVSVILDGENCWEHYADDGMPFLTALYEALEAAPDIRTVTPSEVLAAQVRPPALPMLHSGSWIDADFHIWAGHAEKNRAWDLLARTRAALVASGATRDSHPQAWLSLAAAEGSDWFWWFGEDHYTADKALFDSLFRAHLQGVHEKAGLPVPGWLALPVSGRAKSSGDLHTPPTALVHATVDGRLTRYYEWHGAGLWKFGTGGGSMHRVTAPVASAMHYGFDEECFYLRLDFAEDRLPGEDASLVLEVLAPVTMRLRVDGLAAGAAAFGREDGEPLPGAIAALDDVLEIGLPLSAFRGAPGQVLELMLHVERGKQRLESLPSGEPLRIVLPGPEWDAAHWSA
ncbi:MAG: glycoside hydrolase family 57 protein [Candidatus Eisenbacteria bacterium]